jgi:ribosome-associated toxin RatA of RatAB toxin-antitoxin module
VPRVESVVQINADIDKVFNLARDVESFPEFMPDVKSVVVLEKNDDATRTVTEFTAIIKEFKTTMKWVEEDIWNVNDKTCKFDLVRGDFKSYSGMWTFKSVDGSTEYRSVIDFEYDIPMIGALIKGLITKKMQQNVDNILNAIKMKAESTN